MLCWRNPCSLWLLNALALSLSGGALARPCLLWKACLSPGDPLTLSSSPRSEAAAPAPHLTALPVTASHCLATVWLLHGPRSVPILLLWGLPLPALKSGSGHLALFPRRDPLTFPCLLSPQTGLSRDLRSWSGPPSCIKVGSAPLASSPVVGEGFPLQEVLALALPGDGALEARLKMAAVGAGIPSYKLLGPWPLRILLKKS